MCKSIDSAKDLKMKFRALAFGAFAAANGVCTAMDDEWLSIPAEVYELIGTQANATSGQVNYQNAYPNQGSCQGCYKWATSPAYNNWVAGFYPGILFKLMNYSTSNGDKVAAAWWESQGNAYASYVATNKNNTGTHDVGFMLLPPFLQQYDLTGNASAAEILVQGASSLAKRFNPIVGCFESWGAINPPNHQFEVIVDNMVSSADFDATFLNNQPKV